MIPIIRPWLGQQEAQAAYDAVMSGWVAQGPKVLEFERAFADHLGVAAAVAVSSATTGLHLALYAAGVRAGDEVVCPSLSFIATANAVQYCGATPVFADVDARSQNLTPASIAAVLTAKTRAVLLVHQVGMPADIGAIRGLLPPSVALVEDAACAIGSTYRGALIGRHSPQAVFSFHPRKLVTTGEGGMIALQDPDVAAHLRILRQHGMSLSDVARHQSQTFVLEQYEELGWNYRMTDIQAAIGLVQLGKLPAMVAARRLQADSYRQLLCHRQDLLLPEDPPWGTTNYQSYCIKLLNPRVDRNKVLQRLMDRQIGAKRGIMAAHLEKTYAKQRHASLPETEIWTHRSLVLPMFHDITLAQQQTVATALEQSLIEG